MDPFQKLEHYAHEAGIYAKAVGMAFEACSIACRNQNMTAAKIELDAVVRLLDLLKTEILRFHETWESITHPKGLT